MANLTPEQQIAENIQKNKDRLVQIKTLKDKPNKTQQELEALIALIVEHLGG